MARIPYYARPGELLKGPAHVRSTAHLANIRKLPCVNCGLEPCGEAAHVRTYSPKHHKNNPGMGRKPGDNWAVPLCHDCHMSQHARGERRWWQYVCGIDSIKLAAELWAFHDDLATMRDVTIMAFVSKNPTRPAEYWKRG